MSVESYDQLAEALRDIRTRFGDNAFADKRRLISLLSDKAPDAKRDIRAIATAIDEGVPAALSGAERHLLGLEMDRQANKLESSTGLRLDIARQIVRVIAFALDLGPPPSVYQGAAPEPPPAPDAWAGVSQPVQPAAEGTLYPDQPGRSVPTRTKRKKKAPPPSGFQIGSLRIERNHIFIGAAALAAVAAAGEIMSGGGGSGGGETVRVGENTMAPAGRPTPTPASTTSAPAAARSYAGELTDYGIAAKRTLESNVGSPTPLEVPVGRRLTTAEVQALVARDPSTRLVDVLANPHPSTLQGAAYLPSVGLPGTLNDATQGQAARELKSLVGERPDRPLVFFCAGAICWESYNAMLRAEAAGFRNIFWYRGGLASWAEAGLPMQPLQPPAQANNNLMFRP